MPPNLGHLILFLPLSPSTTLPLAPSFLSKHFTLTPGGHHADNLTSNTLILLADGCYIELICFLSRDAAKGHWWGPDAGFVGWRDWCLTGAVGKGVKDGNGGKEGGGKSEGETKGNGGGDGKGFDVDGYDTPIIGGRTRPDGISVKWSVTFPHGPLGGQSKRGRVPFFCHDVTDRSVRVPIDEAKTSHACGALGVRSLTVIVKDKEMLEETKRVYDGVFGEEGVVRESGEEVWFGVRQVERVEGVGGARVVLRLPRGKEEVQRVEKMGYWFGDVVLGAKARDSKLVGMVERLDEEKGEGCVGGLWIEYF